MRRAHAILGLFAVAPVGCGGMTAPAPPTPVPCDAKMAEGLAVSETDAYGGQPYALGYPPYAIDGCKLAYVAKGGGDLRLRDLTTGEETVIEPAAAKPRRPAIAGDRVAWEATLDGKAVVRVGGAAGATTLAGGFDHAGEPRAAVDAVVFTGWLGADDQGDTDVFLYTPSTGAVTVLAKGPGQQRFADVSATHAAWSDFSEGPTGTFADTGSDAADIVVLDRATMAVTTRKRPGKQAFPMLGAGGKVAYLDWGLVHPEPKFSEYDLQIGEVTGDGSGDAHVAHIMTLVPYMRPVARAARLEWVATTPAGTTELQRRGVDLVTPVETVKAFPGLTVFGPTASDTLTLVGALEADGSVTLRAFTR